MTWQPGKRRLPGQQREEAKPERTYSGKDVKLAINGNEIGGYAGIDDVISVEINLQPAIVPPKTYEKMLEQIMGGNIGATERELAEALQKSADEMERSMRNAFQGIDRSVRPPLRDDLILFDDFRFSEWLTKSRKVWGGDMVREVTLGADDLRELMLDRRRYWGGPQARAREFNGMSGVAPPSAEYLRIMTDRAFEEWAAGPRQIMQYDGSVITAGELSISALRASRASYVAAARQLGVPGLMSIDELGDRYDGAFGGLLPAGWPQPDEVVVERLPPDRYGYIGPAVLPMSPGREFMTDLSIEADERGDYRAVLTLENYQRRRRLTFIGSIKVAAVRGLFKPGMPVEQDVPQARQRDRAEKISAEARKAAEYYAQFTVPAEVTFPPRKKKKDDLLPGARGRTFVTKEGGPERMTVLVPRTMQVCERWLRERRWNPKHALIRIVREGQSGQLAGLALGDCDVYLVGDIASRGDYRQVMDMLRGRKVQAMQVWP